MFPAIRSITSATALMMSAEANMPILIASAPMSSRTTSICLATNSAGTAITP